MRSKLLIISIFVVLFLFYNSFHISGQTSIPLISIDKEIYLVEETVNINIGLPPEEYDLYELQISSVQGTFTYKGEFNPIMFFYPTEEGIYTIALVEKSTGAIYYSISFTVNPKEGYTPPNIVEIVTETKEIPEIEEGPVESSGPIDSVYTDKKEYVFGEHVRVFVTTADIEKVSLFHSYQGISKRYMGDLSYISFIPKEVGTHTLFLKDNDENIISAYVFEVKKDISKKTLKLINSRGVVEAGNIKVIKEINGLDSLEIIPDKKILKKIKLRNYKESGGLTFGIDDVPTDKVNIRQKNVVKAFALDPSNINFTNGTATGTAVGNELWKCKEWDFANQGCLGTWIKIADITPGQEYNITLTLDDPGFAEILITDAIHLDENKSYISDIYDYVKSQDNNWSEPIYENEYVRVTFEKNLTSSNDITLYVRNNQSLNTTVEVYYFNSTKKITEFPIISETKYYKEFLTGMNGSHDTFDLKIIAKDNNSQNAYLEFDHIIDPTTYYDPNSNVQQGWNDGTGTSYTEVDDGDRQPGAPDTSDYISARANDNSYSEFGFSTITETPIYIVLWIYAGSSNCGFLAYLQQGGTTIGTIDVNPGSTNNWFSYNWTNPSGSYDAMTVEVYQDSKGSGGPGYCYLYEAYLEVNYNSPPNITNLTYPPNGTNLSSGTNIDFNFTVNDDKSPVTSCVLYGNFTGIWEANESIASVPINTETGFTIDVSDGSYIWNVNCTDQYGAYDYFTTNYTLRVDTTYPTIDFSTGMEPNNTYINQDWIYVNVTANDTNEANITFRLYNTTGPVNITTYYTNIREINFSNLDPNMQYWYNVTVCDEFGWCNTTETRKLTLDNLYPTINYSTGTEDNDTYFNRTWIYVNVTANDTNEANITFRLYNTSGSVNITTYYTNIREINFTNLDPNMQYWYNVTIIDWAGQENTTINYKITLDNTNPTINFSTGMEPNNTFINQNWIYVNVSADDTNEANITFRLYNTSGPVNISPYYTSIREVNFTDLDPNMQYWFNVSIVDWVNQENSTVIFTITLDNTFPTIDLTFPPNDTWINYNSTQFNYTPIDNYLDACVLYGNFSGPFDSNETHSNPVNGTNNSFGPITLDDGRYIWNVMCNDSAGNTNFSAYNYTVKIDTHNPVITNWKTNGTAFIIYDFVCLNVSVTDGFSGVDTVYAEIEDPNTDVVNWTLLDDGSGCDVALGDNIYSLSHYAEIGGNYTWLNTYANDSAGNWQKNTTNLEWNVTAAGSMTVNMTYPSADIKINESEYNYNFTINCNVSCDSGGVDCENTTVYAQYNPSDYVDITTATTDLVNAEDNFSCGTLTAGGAYCLHTFNITSGSDSGGNTWPVRCSATSDSVGSYVSGEWSVTINDHPFANFSYPINNTWLTGVEMINASESIDSDGTIASYLFEYDNNTAFSSPATICNGASVNCTWNTSQNQNQCDNNTLSCYLRITVTDNDGLTNSTYIIIGFDTNAPNITLGLPRDFENITSSPFNVNATPQDDESGVDTVTFEYRRNNTDTWTFACNDDRDPAYDCEWDVSSLPDGNTYEFRAYANDTKGNSGSPDVHTNITIDRAGPIIYLEIPVNQSNQTVNNITFYYNATDAHSNIANCSLVIDSSIVNTTYSPAENTSLFLNYTLSDGSYNWNINCTDVHGNQNTSEIREINVDTTGPVSTLDLPYNDSFVTGSTVDVNASVVESGSAEVDTATFEYRRNSTDTWTIICRDDRDPTYDCNWDTTVLPDGDEYEVRVYANDTWGNVGNNDTHINITVDNNLPNVTLVSPAPFATDTDGDLVFVYRVADVSPIRNCSLIINGVWNQSNDTITRDTNQYFYINGVDDGVELNWSVNCTDYINLTDKSEFRNVSVTLNADMTVNLSLNKSVFYASETAVITHNVTDTASQPISDADVRTAIVFANTTVPWWNGAWERRKPITLSSGSDLTNVLVEVNVSGLDNNISSCENEIRIIRFDTNNVLTNVNRSPAGGDDATYCVVRFRVNISAGVDNTEYMAYYNNSGATAPNNNETRLTTNTTLNAMGGSVLGSQYNVNDGTFSDTTSDDNTNYFAVGRDNSPPSGQPLNAYLNLSYNVSNLGLGVTEKDIVSYNFTINYCHSNDVSAPITCGAAIGAGTPGTAYVELFDYDTNAWDAGFDTITQNVNSAAENTETYIETDTPDDYAENTTGILQVRYEVDIGGLGKSDDASFALDYAYLNVYYKEEIYTGLETIESTQWTVATNTSATDYQGLWTWNWDTTGQAQGNYTATTYGNKTGYNDNYDYEWFEILTDTTGPVSTLDRPLQDSTVDGVALGFTYTVNATVTDADVGIIDTVTFMYRYNSTDTWKLICKDHDGTAPFECSWDLSTLNNGWDYEVLVYANDSLGNLGDNNTHDNITVITEYINITSIIVDDNVDIPLDQIDLIAGTTKTVYCNMTIWDPEVYTNISAVNATFYSSTTTFDASDANQTHYTNTSCTLISGGGNTADYLCGFTVWHFAMNGTWECRGYTENDYSSNTSIDNTTINQLFAINISTTVIDYTDLEPDQESPNVEVNVSNVGNMPMNISVYGFGGEDEVAYTDLSMVCEINNISVEFERFSTSSGVAYDSKNQLSSTPQDIGLTIPAKASEAEVKVNSTYWQFMVPPQEQAFGQCNGSVVFMAESP